MTHIGDPFQRVLFVHAHPDDETIATGGTIVNLVQGGATVTVLTCTRGERGEVIPAELQHLEGDGAALAEHRERELAAAMRILGVRDHRFLGNPDARIADAAPRRYCDSGMRWGPGGPEPVQDLDRQTLDRQTLCSADFGEVAADIATVIADVQPGAVVSYDADGGYGHPDHVLVHEATRHAALVMGVPFFTIAPHGPPKPGDRVVDIRGVLEIKKEALRAHRTQLTVDGDTIIHSGGQVQPIATTESFRAYGEPAAGEVDWSSLHLVWKIVVGVIALAVGVFVGLIATVNHQINVDVAGARFPLGVIVSLAVCAGILAGARLYFGTRIVAGCAALGILAVVTVLAADGPGGSVLVPANTAGWTWMIGSAVIAVAVLVWPQPKLRTPATMGKSAAGEEENPQ